MDTPSPCLLAVQNLSIRYPQNHTQVISHLNFELRRGEIACLLGASGCGKTSILRAIAGFLTPTEGCITIAGKIVSQGKQQLPPEQREIGIVFQDYALFPHLSVRDNIGFGLQRLKKSEQQRRVNDLLQLVNMTTYAQRYPHELSGGQQQRVALARALAPCPQLLLLDEPFSNLDVELRDKLSLEVRDILKKAGTTAILVTHDQYEAFAMADIIGVFERGHLAQWDTPYRIYHEPATRQVADFIGQGVFLPGTRVKGGIQIELGLLPGPDMAPGPHNTRVDVLIRPDDIVHDDASPMQATVDRKAFRGSEFIYTLALASGARVFAHVPSHHNHAIGEQIGIRLEIDHVVTFPCA